MRAIRPTVFTLLCLAFAAQLPAQSAAPGYLGRRLSLEYSLAVWAPVYIEGGVLGGLSNYQGTKLGWPDDKFYLSRRHQVGMNLCLSRRSVVGGHFSWQQAGYSSGYYSFASNYVDTLGLIKVPGAHLLWRSFYFLRRGNIAPVGPFSEVGYALLFPGLKAVGAAKGAALVRKMYSSVCLHAGYTAALADRVLFSFGAEVQFPLFNKALHPLTVTARDGGNEGVLFDTMTRLSSFGFRFSLQGLLF